MSNSLSTEQAGRYERDGYLAPLDALSPAEVGAARASLAEFESRVGPSINYLHYRQLHLFFRWAYDLAVHPSVLDAVEGILGPNILVHSSTVFYKRGRDQSYVSWHQDGYYWNVNVPRSVSAWMALSESGPANGCMRVIPGSHARGRLPHAQTAVSGNNMLASGMEVASGAEESRAVDVSLAPGQMSLHHIYLVHGSRPNPSDTERVGYAVRYVATEVKQTLPHHAVLLARGHDDYGHYELRGGPPLGTAEESHAAHAGLLRWIGEMREREVR
ncbi:MAG: phytanoyl-CoA dioxygenase family protein [Acidobacteria bacterium]|nr:phytanoyl-CoA dioxygenase family protein [Acidobacteriota bacterium]